MVSYNAPMETPALVSVRVFHVAEKVLFNLICRKVLGETVDRHLTTYFITSKAADAVCKKFLPSIAFKTPIPTVIYCRPGEWISIEPVATKTEELLNTATPDPMGKTQAQRRYHRAVVRNKRRAPPPRTRMPTVSPTITTQTITPAPISFMDRKENKSDIGQHQMILSSLNNRPQTSKSILDTNTKSIMTQAVQMHSVQTPRFTRPTMAPERSAAQRTVDQQ